MRVPKNATGQSEPLEGGELPLCSAPKHDSQIYISSVDKGGSLVPWGFQ